MSFTLDMDSICRENKQENDSQTKLSNTNKSFLGNSMKIFLLHTVEINRELLVLKSKWVIKSHTINSRKKIGSGKRRRLLL
jgi:hypothetical protein